jgi:hypothetical protein
MRAITINDYGVITGSTIAAANCCSDTNCCSELLLRHAPESGARRAGSLLIAEDPSAFPIMFSPDPTYPLTRPSGGASSAKFRLTNQDY